MTQFVFLSTSHQFIFFLLFGSGLLTAKICDFIGSLFFPLPSYPVSQQQRQNAAVAGFYL
jgi:hypothetical protein